MVADFGALQARGALVGCKIGGTLVGFIAAYVKDDHLFIENVAVDPDFQARGIGGQLIAFAETEARFRGLDKVELYTNAGMKENLALYSHLGYEVFDRRVEDGFDRVYFRKNL